MGLKVISRRLNGLILFEPVVRGDHRGFFMESFRADEFEALDLPLSFVQDNHSRSLRGVLRGMHFQWDKPQGKLIRVTRGSAFIAEVDIRPGSLTIGEHETFELTEENKYVLWVPPGFANGFCALEDGTEMQYKCTALWNKYGESSINCLDPELGIKWPLKDVSLSEKDHTAQTFKEWLSTPEAEEFRI